MKTKSIFYITLLAVLSFSFMSCSDDDDVEDPKGTITLNMHNEDNGKTSLGNSDVYIDKANNFFGRYCPMTSFGKKNGLGDISEPMLQGLTSKIAVVPGNAFQIFHEGNIMEFSSGKQALKVSADYYNAYVVSQIKKGDEVIGATVKFALMDVFADGLPEYNSSIGELRFSGDEITVTLPSSDFEFETDNGYNLIEYEKRGKQLIAKLVEFRQRDNFGIYIRVNNKYTYVYGQVL